MTDRNERIIEVIKKCLGLSKDNPSATESVAAALKAQQLMVKYNIEEHEILDEIQEEPIEEVENHVGTGKKWKYQLGAIIGKNFRCKCFYRGKKSVIFYGYRTDAAIASQVFNFLLNAGNKLANKEVYNARKNGYHTDGIYNSFCLEFLQGVKSKLEKQSFALMIVIPPKVEEEYELYSTGFGKLNSSLSLSRLNKKVFENGEQSAKELLDSRHIGCSEDELLIG